MATEEFGLYLVPPNIIDMNHPYAHIMPKIKELLRSTPKSLFLKDSKVIPYLASIPSSEIAALDFGAYPAIEALAFAVLGLCTLCEDGDEPEYFAPRDPMCL